MATKKSPAKTTAPTQPEPDVTAPDAPAPEETPERSTTQAMIDDAADRAADKSLLELVRVTDPKIDNWFRYHKPDAEQIQSIQRVREACAACAQVIMSHTPPSADQSAAVRHIREASMTANAAIVCRGK